MIERDKEFTKAIDEIIAGIETAFNNQKKEPSFRENHDKKNQS